MTTTARLPNTAESVLDWGWEEYSPYYERLIAIDVGPDTIGEFMAGWTELADVIEECEARLYLAKTANTADEEADARFKAYLDNVYPKSAEAEQKLKEKLLASGLEPPGFAMPLRKMRAQTELFREANVPLLAEEQKLVSEYDEISGAQTIEWKGEEIPLAMVMPIYQDPDRSTREEAWRLASSRRLDDRGKIDEVWRKFLALRLRLAENAGLPDYRQYRWRQQLRFDYTPEHNKRFHKAVKDTVVPAIGRMLEHRRQQLELPALRPWDLRVDPKSQPPLRPYATAEELESGISRIFHNVDGQLGTYFDQMRAHDLLDLDSRKNKGPGAFCTTLSRIQEPFIFMNGAGTHMDVHTLLHEGGHAFHAYESAHLPLHQQRSVGLEFAEVASMSMELLAAPYLSADQGGFYTASEAARARIEALERILAVWITVTQTDEFQHWVYENPEAAADGAACDAEWTRLNTEYDPFVDWTGLAADRADGWRRILHIHVVPFYVIEYAVAQLAAVQLWAQALENQAAAVERYRKALALGGTRSLPELFEAVGVEFDFGERSLQPAVQLIESTLAVLRPIAEQT